MDKTKGKVILEDFFDAQCLVQSELIPEGCTVNKDMYVEILCCFRDTVRRNNLEKWA
jgi:hypothetical protein